MPQEVINIPDCKERVALDLMTAIAGVDAKGAEEQASNPRSYYLKLYADCLSVVNGNDAPEAEDSELAG